MAASLWIMLRSLWNRRLRAGRNKAQGCRPLALAHVALKAFALALVSDLALALAIVKAGMSNTDTRLCKLNWRLPRDQHWHHERLQKRSSRSVGTS